MSRTHQICPKCSTKKLKEDFYNSYTKKTGKSGYCKKCQGAYNAAYDLTPKGKRSKRLSVVKRKYRLSKTEFEALEVKFPACAICGKEFSGPEPFIDHDHVTGQVRSLLCFLCNVMLGNAKDNPKILRKAAAYLEEHKALGKSENITPVKHLEPVNGAPN